MMEAVARHGYLIDVRNTLVIGGLGISPLLVQELLDIGSVTLQQATNLSALATFCYIGFKFVCMVVDRWNHRAKNLAKQHEQEMIKLRNEYREMKLTNERIIGELDSATRELVAYRSQSLARALEATASPPESKD